MTTTTLPDSQRETRIRLVELTEQYRADMQALGFECTVQLGTMADMYRSLVEIHVNAKREDGVK